MRSLDTDDDDARSIRTVVPHELEWVKEEDENQLARQEEDSKRMIGGDEGLS